MNHPNLKTTAAIGIAAFFAFGGTTHAHSGATGIVKERMDLMASIGKAMKTITEMFQGEKPYDAAKVREAASFIGSHGAEQMTSLFPEDSIEGPSEALPAIWQDWDRFLEIANQLTVSANALSTAADNPRGMQSGGMGSGMGGRSMGSNAMGQRNPMMGGSNSMPMNDPEALAQMPPDASFARLTQTCSACHTQFRKKQ